MWVARDKDGDLKFFANKPIRNEDYWAEHPLGEFCRINDWLFPELKWEDEPIEVNICEFGLIEKYEELKDAYDALHMAYLSQVSLYKSLYEEEKKK